MRARTTHPAAGFALAAVAAFLCGACGDSGSAKGSPSTTTPAKDTPAKNSPETLPEIPKDPMTEPAKPMNEPAPPPPPAKPAETKTTPPTTPPIEKKPAGELATYHCDSCGKDAVASAADPAPACCGVAMRPKP